MRYKRSIIQATSLKLLLFIFLPKLTRIPLRACLASLQDPLTSRQRFLFTPVNTQFWRPYCTFHKWKYS